MKTRREDARNLALIAGAGAVGLLGTLAVREIMISAMFCSFSAPPIPPASTAPMVGSERVIVPPIAQLRRMDLPSHAGVEGDWTIRIRSRFGGERSYPIIYVDNIRVRGSLHTLMRDKATIDRIEMIKGPAAKSLYGTEASAGAVRILRTTPRTRRKSPRSSGGAGNAGDDSSLR